MLTRKRFAPPNLSGDWKKDGPQVLAAISKYLLSLEGKQSLTLDSATGLNNTPVGDKTASTGAFTTLSASSTLTASGLIDASGASAGQVKFPATQNASTDANTLDDYAEKSTTPTPTSGTGTFTSVAGAVKCTKVGNRVFVTATAAITTNGTAATDVRIELPYSAAETTAISGVNAGSGAGLSGFVTGSSLRLFKPDGTYPGADGAVLVGTGSFRV